MTCKFDFLEVYDGADQSNLLAKMCGAIQAPVFRSTSNHMTLYFKSDRTSHYTGFEANVLFTYGKNQARD